MPNDVDLILKNWWRMTSFHEHLNAYNVNVFVFILPPWQLHFFTNFSFFLLMKTPYHYWNNSDLN